MKERFLTRRNQEMRPATRRRSTPIIKMEPKKDIFDLFRDSDNKLTERPSGQAWGRLSGRLDKHRRRHQQSNQRLLGMVAGVLLLIAIIALLSVLTDHQVKEQVAEAKLDFQLEDLKTDESGAEALKVVEFSHQYQDRLAIPMEDGRADKRLVARSQNSARPVQSPADTDSVKNLR